MEDIFLFSVIYCTKTVDQSFISETYLQDIIWLKPAIGYFRLLLLRLQLDINNHISTKLQ